jgi:hypothetical protein
MISRLELTVNGVVEYYSLLNILATVYCDIRKVSISWAKNRHIAG